MSGGLGGVNWFIFEHLTLQCGGSLTEAERPGERANTIKSGINEFQCEGFMMNDKRCFS